ncbi:MAG: prolyl oligopeptidase family serine peptidase [Chitinophagaceae bacterium]|nr:prolyl oligopeptidase family serine peptidase [Chitinophagaceae bacterium]
MTARLKLSLILILTSCYSYSQNVYHFTKGLMIDSRSRYGREALYTDPIVYKMYTGTLNKPIEGDSLTTNDRGEVTRWQSVNGDSINRLRSRGGFRGGFGSAGNYFYLTYKSSKQQTALLHIKGNSSVIFNGVHHAGDPYALGYMYIPVKLNKGLNELYVRGGSITADIIFPGKSKQLNTDDPTLPFIVTGNDNADLMGAIVAINTSTKTLKGLKIKSSIGGKDVTSDVPDILPMSTRKIIFHFDGTGTETKGQHDCRLQLLDKEKVIDETTVKIEAVDATDKYSVTFISSIDGSLQYYAVTPQTPSFKKGSSLFLSVHGAGVEAIGQARAYHSKDWGTLVAATNRRPRGFNWEDWGRIDALEVLNLARKKFTPDSQHIYLTGHSMGGHGTWFLGATYPDKWAAIAPCAGYPTLKGYGSADGLVPDSSSSTMEQLLLRSGNQSDVIKLVSNYRPLGVYIHHGDSDRVVPVTFARQMRKLLGEFHPDLSYHEYPGGSHWFGNESVDWPPLFDFFKWHKREADSAVNNIDFITANPGISSSFRWAEIVQQHHPLQFSRIVLNRNKTDETISGRTENVHVIKFNLEDFGANKVVNISLDGNSSIKYTTKSSNESIYLLKQDDKWSLSEKPALSQKGPHRYGTFKDAFNHHMVFVYGTTGNKQENEWSLNKARYDAETWHYRGNGSVDIVSDKEFSIEKYKDRGVIIYGNKNTNRAYSALLSDCPIQLERNKITAAGKTFTGDAYGAYLVWPIKGSGVASVAVIAGSGLKGMNAANANQYFAGASGFPDFMIFEVDMVKTGPGGVKMAGFYDNNWELSGNDFAIEN